MRHCKALDVWQFVDQGLFLLFRDTNSGQSFSLTPHTMFVLYTGFLVVGRDGAMEGILNHLGRLCDYDPQPRRAKKHQWRPTTNQATFHLQVVGEPIDG